MTTSNSTKVKPRLRKDFMTTLLLPEKGK